MAAQPICNRKVSGFKSPLGLHSHQVELGRNGPTCGPSDAKEISRARVGEWLIPADCKSAALRLRRFESCPVHQSQQSTEAAG